MPEPVRVVEVGPRDGLQNEAAIIPTEVKVAFIDALVDAGLDHIEVTSFVSPKRIPQLADAAEVFRTLLRQEGVTYSALVPNLKGLERALASGVSHIAVFTAASETFTQRNIGMSIAESLETFAAVARAAIAKGVRVRGYVSTCWVCPYEGEIRPERVRDVAQALYDMGCDEISLGDTIGAAVPTDVGRTLDVVLSGVSVDSIALHFHDTYGTALANVYAGLQAGVRTFDASAGGLGGCPYAPGASGNLATEDLVYMLNRMGYPTGVTLDRLAKASLIMQGALGRPLPSKQLQRLLSIAGTDH